MKKLLLLLLCLVLAMSFVLTSCNKDDEENNEENNENNENNETTHTHSWGEWIVKTPATCTAKGQEERACSGCTEKEVRDITVPHNGVIVCETCYTPLITFDAVTVPEMSSFGVKISNYSAKFTEGSALNTGVMGMENAELFVTVDEDGMLQGYGTGKLTMAYGYDNNRVSAVDAKFYIEDNVLWFDAYGVTPMNNSTNPDDVVGYIDVTKIAELVEIKAQAEQAMAMVNQYLPAVETWYEESLAPIFANVKLDGVEAAFNKYTAALLNSLFVKTETGAALSFEAVKTWYAAILTDDISVLVDKVVGEGTYASLEALVADDKLYNYSVADLLNYLKTEQGVDLGALLDAIDGLVAVFMPAEDGAPAPTFETNVLPMLLSMMGASVELPENFDLNAVLADETVLALSVKDALLMVEGEVDNPDTPDVNEAEVAFAALKADIVKYFADLKTMTVFELVQSFGPNVDKLPNDGGADGKDGADGNDNTPVPLSETEEEDPTAAMIESFNAMVDQAAKIFTFTLAIGEGNVVSAINVNVAIPGKTGEGIVIVLSKNLSTFVLTSSELTLNLTVTNVLGKTVLTMKEVIAAEGAEFDMTMEFIPDYTINYDAANLTALKAEVKVGSDALTKENILAAFNDYYDGWSGVKVIDDGDRLIIVDYNGTSTVNEQRYANLEITYVTYTDVFGLALLGGCTDTVEVSPVFNAKRGTATVEILDTALNTSALILAQITADTIPEPEEANVENTTENAEFLLNTKTGVASADDYNKGHNYVYQEATSTTGDNCTAVYYDHYKCSICQAEYKYYWTKGHNESMKSELVDGVYVVTESCEREGCTYSKSIGTVSVNCDLTGATNSAENADVDKDFGNNVLVIEYAPDGSQSIDVSYTDEKGNLYEIYCVVFVKYAGNNYVDHHYSNYIYGEDEVASFTVGSNVETCYIVICLESVKGDIDATVNVGLSDGQPVQNEDK